MMRILKHVHVNIPFIMLKEAYLPRFVEAGINPEIGFDAPSLETFSVEDYSGIARQIHQHHLKVTFHGPFMDLSPGSPDPSVLALTRRRFEQVLRLAGLFRPLRIVCHSGYDWKRYGHLYETWIENSAQTWAWMARGAKDEGAVLMLENVYERGPEELAPLLKTVHAQGVGFCLDTGHQAAFGTAPLLVWTETLFPYLGQLHLHDNLGDRDEHLAIGQGNIDFEGLFRTLRKLSEHPLPVTLEPHREEDLLPGLEYLERIWPWPL
jgi:sugar phosphate isomerase/epimerase